MKTNEKKRLLLIVCCVVSISLFFVVIELYVRSGPVENQRGPRASQQVSDSGEPLLREAGPMKSVKDAPWSATTQEGNRTIAEYLERRAYPGAPPVIPHDVKENGVEKSDCQSCHEEGGYAEKFEAYAPVTPHLRDEMQNCRQCHQPAGTEKTFRKTDWKTVTPPGNDRPGLPSAPPRIPHDLQYRTFCVSCHSGPGAVEGLRTDHPDRSNCRQCHQPKRTDELWKRESDD